MKKVLFAFFLALALLPFVSGQAQAAALGAADAYKAIVEITLVAEVEEGFISKISRGSGFLISESGLLVTNHHVVTTDLLSGLDDDSRIPFPKLPLIDSYLALAASEAGENEAANARAFIVCLTMDKESAPDCSYTADFVASDEDLDVALLKLKPISGLSTQTKFPYLSLADASLSIGSELSILGYPGTGGDTITITDGTASGRIEENGLYWIKTDTYASYGNSGGPGIDENGRVIGLISKGNGLNYLLDISSFSDWVSQKKSTAPTLSPIGDRAIAFHKKGIALLKTDIFQSDLPAISIKKPAEWAFNYDSESGISASRKDDYYSGRVGVNFKKMPRVLEPSDLDWMFAMNFIGEAIEDILISKEEKMLGATKAYLFTYSEWGSVSKVYMIPHGNHMLSIEWSNGKDDKDEALVQAMIETITLLDYVPNTYQIGLYESRLGDYQFDFRNQPWLVINVPPILEEQVEIMAINETTKNMYFIPMVVKTPADERELSNNQRYKEAVKEIDGLSAEGSGEEILRASSYINIGQDINDAILVDMVEKKKNEAMSRYVVYQVRSGGYDYMLVALMFGDPETWDAALKDFEKILASFKIEGYQPATIKEELIQQGFSAAGTGDDQSEETASGEEAVVEPSVSEPEGGTQPEEAMQEAPIEINNQSMHDRLRGKIMIRVEDAGKAYYINPGKKEMYYLGRPDDAFAVMRSQGIGIKNADLEKIPMATSMQSGVDTDNDGLSDLFESAIGTDKDKKDSDADGYDDKMEIGNGYSPTGKGALKLDQAQAEKHKGKIFLQVENHGEAWYVSPADAKRYFLGRPADAFALMRALGLGINDSDFAKLQK